MNFTFIQLVKNINNIEKSTKSSHTNLLMIFSIFSFPKKSSRTNYSLHMNRSCVPFWPTIVIATRWLLSVDVVIKTNWNKLKCHSSYIMFFLLLFAVVLLLPLLLLHWSKGERVGWCQKRFPSILATCWPLLLFMFDNKHFCNSLDLNGDEMIAYTTTENNIHVWNTTWHDHVWEPQSYNKHSVPRWNWIGIRSAVCSGVCVTLPMRSVRISIISFRVTHTRNAHRTQPMIFIDDYFGLDRAFRMLSPCVYIF